MIVGATEDNHTSFYHLMKTYTNGDKIVLKKLDECVLSNGKEADDENFRLQVNYSHLESNTSTCDVVKDIISIRELQSTGVLLHPVIMSYIDIRWKKMKSYIYTNFSIYMFFLCCYSLFLGNIFYRELHEDPILDKILVGNGKAGATSGQSGHVGSGIESMNIFEVTPSLTRELEGFNTYVKSIVVENYTIAIFKNPHANLTR